MENINNIEFWDKLSEQQQEELNLYIEASKAYYTGEEPIMSDAQFDNLSDTLLEYGLKVLTHFISARLYRKDLGLITVDEVKFNETQEMISLKKEKYKDKSSVVEIKKFFFNQIKNTIQLQYAPKFDGGALKILWDLEKRIVKQILTRGGLDVTHLFKNHFDIQRTYKYNKPIICGELVIAKSTFNEKYSIDGDNEYEYENARNFVGSLLKQSSISQEIHDDLNFIQCTDGVNALEAPEIWTDMSLNDFYRLEDIVKYYKSDSFPYLCDGIVIAYKELGQRQVENNYPLNMLAIKFPGARCRSKVIGFEWTQKKSGKLTPKVLVEPTKLEGITISCASGYNYENLLTNHIGIGSTVEIEKTGDIIPVVVKVLTYSNTITMPSCEYKREGKHLKAINLEESRKYKFILGLNILQLDGIGPTLGNQIGKVVDYDIIELFNNTHKPDICNVLGNGSNWNKFQEVYNIKNLHLDRLIHLLQFDNVGIVLSKKIALLLIKKSTDSSNIPTDVKMNVCKGDGFIKINESIVRLKQYGISIIAPVEINESTISFEMTQDPPGMTKQEFVKKLKEKYPNSIHTALTKETKYLFCNDITVNTGKLNKARKYNVKIVTYLDAFKHGNL